LIDQDLLYHNENTLIIDNTTIAAMDTDVLDSPTNWIPLCYKFSTYSGCLDTTSLITELYDTCTTHSATSAVIESTACQDLFKT